MHPLLTPEVTNKGLRSRKKKGILVFPERLLYSSRLSIELYTFSIFRAPVMKFVSFCCREVLSMTRAGLAIYTSFRNHKRVSNLLNTPPISEAFRFHDRIGYFWVILLPMTELVTAVSYGYTHIVDKSSSSRICLLSSYESC